MIRVGFILADGSDGWLGGLNYRRNLLIAVMSNPDREIEPVLIVPPSLPASQLSGFPAVRIVRTRLADLGHRVHRIGYYPRRLLDRDLSLEWLMRRHRIDLLSHSAPLGARSRLPSINWIPDFQHVRLPNFFTTEDRAHRDVTFRDLIAGSRRIVVSSGDAARDFEAFAPGARDKVRVLHFVAGFDQAVEQVAREALELRFDFTGPFFHLPNQFWAHKNHALVIEALAILGKRGIPALVLSTGKTQDSRDPGHFHRLMARAAELGVAESFRPLGVVSQSELQGLMLSAVALINPSRFEGWSTTVEEAKSLGLPIILTDIPVHIEQDPPNSRYFDAESAESLADAMTAALGEDGAAVRARARDAAKELMPARLQRFGRAYEAIALETLRE